MIGALSVQSPFVTWMSHLLPFQGAQTPIQNLILLNSLSNAPAHHFGPHLQLHLSV